jgi:hypothetical protein
MISSRQFVRHCGELVGPLTMIPLMLIGSKNNMRFKSPSSSFVKKNRHRPTYDVVSDSRSDRREHVVCVLIKALASLLKVVLL